MSLYGSDFPFYIIVHEYDANGQCVFWRKLGEYNDFDTVFQAYMDIIKEQWKAESQTATHYDYELIECNPIYLYHPHGCTDRTPVVGH